MRNTHVSTPLNAAKSIEDGSCAEHTRKCFPISTSVRGNPARKGAASAEEIPGTSSYENPLARRASISLLARENTDGHPPFSLATILPFAQRETRRLSMSGCVHERASPPRLPTCTRSALGGASSSRAASDAPRSSWTTTSHARSRRRARTVTWSMPPGPAPMRNTLPFFFFSVDRPPAARVSAEARAGSMTRARVRRQRHDARRGAATDAARALMSRVPSCRDAQSFPYC